MVHSYREAYPVERLLRLAGPAAELTALDVFAFRDSEVLKVAGSRLG